MWCGRARELCWGSVGQYYGGLWTRGGVVETVFASGCAKGRYGIGRSYIQKSSTKEEPEARYKKKAGKGSKEGRYLNKKKGRQTRVEMRDELWIK